MDDTQPLAVPTATDILVVDDNPENLIAIEAALGGLAPLVCARSGREALRLLLDRDFAVILLDVQMPTMNGFETAQLIRSRSRTRHVPIIFITAFAHDDSQVLAAYELGAVDFLFKPLRREILRAKTSVFVELHRRTAEAQRQAIQLREHERAKHRHQLEEQRNHLEQLALRARLDEQRTAAIELRRRADDLARSVAERERAEQALRAANARLEQADRAKDEFLAVLAHELRNPLTPLVAGLELFAHVDDEVLGRARDAMSRQLDHLIRLVDDLLDVSRVTSGAVSLRRGPIDIADVVDQAVALVKPALQTSHHELQVALPDEPATVYADPVRLTQVLGNLLTNAIRYTPPGGHIEVRCERGDDAVTVAVADSGRGMTAAECERVFELFAHSDGSDGLGIGLTLARRLVELHGGTIDAASDGPGKGCQLTITLPLATGDEAAVPIAPIDGASGSRPVTSESLRVVVIEDNDDVRELTTQLLSTWGHVVNAACTGQAGIELVLSLRPDVALVDIGLPDLDGYGVARRIRAELADDSPRLIAMTGFTQQRDRDRAAAAGFHQHIAKPPTGETLRKAIARRT